MIPSGALRVVSAVGLFGRCSHSGLAALASPGD